VLARRAASRCGTLRGRLGEKRAERAKSIRTLTP
jgi:hypothetical protein